MDIDLYSMSVRFDLMSCWFGSLIVLGSLLFTSCSNDTVLTTSTSIGMSADGDVQAVPDHLNVGFRRRELIYAGNNSNHHGSVLAAIDSTTTWNKGSAIEQTSATGYAADIVANNNVAPPREGDSGEAVKNREPLTFVSDTVFGIKAILIPENQGESQSVTLGYKRKIVTRVRPGPNGKLASTYSNTSIHSSPTFGRPSEMVTGPLSVDHQLSEVRSSSSGEKVESGGVRIRQSFAIGSAAEELLKKPVKKKEDEVTAGDKAAENLLNINGQ